MPGQRQEIDAQFIDVDGYFAERLGGIGVDWNAMRMGDVGDGANGLDRAHFIVGVHDADERRFSRDYLAQVLRINQPLPVHGDDGDFAAQAFEEFARLYSRGMFDRTDDDMSILRPAPE